MVKRVAEYGVMEGFGMAESGMAKNDAIYVLLKRIWNLYKMILCYISYIRFYLFKPILKPSANSVSITVSLTTYPARVKWLPVVIGSILRQTRQPNRIVVYLSKEQFENEKIRVLETLRKQGVKVVFEDNDMRSHKKYLYAFISYPNDVIITIDDDIVYDKRMIEDLYNSYLKHPNAVSAKRVHRMRFGNDGRIKKYKDWDISSRELIDAESLELLATGCGGVLYPPHTLDERVTDISAIKNTCLYADDLWLKVMELLKGTPVVLVSSKSYTLKHIWSTDCDGLALSNVNENGNDEQLRKICDYFSLDLYTLTYGDKI